MKRILAFVFAGIAGGMVSVATLYFLKPEADVATKVHLTSNEPNRNLSNVKYVGSIDFTVAAENTVNAVVHVKVRNQMNGAEGSFYNFLFGKPEYTQEQPPVVSSGSGVIISNDGYIVTNNHVIEGAEILEVVLDDRRSFRAKVIGSDPTTDIALIKIEGESFSFLKWGNSDNLRVGEWVLAVGNPFNLASTVTAGIVSAKARSINIINKSTGIEAFIQTDAAVNPGNSGGALVNIEGELIGINTAIASPTGSFSGYSFAVPERIARKIVSDIKEFGSVQRAFIGVSIKEVTSSEAKQDGINSTKGVYISAVAPGGAAQDAGIKAGDVILSVAGISVNRTSELQEQVGQYRPGDQLSVIVQRGNSEKELVLTLRNIEGNTKIRKTESSFEVFGAKVNPISVEQANSLKIGGGLQIIELNEGRFEQAGVKEGFIITTVNHEKVNDVESLRLVLSNSSGSVYVEGVYPNGFSAYYAFGI